MLNQPTVLKPHDVCVGLQLLLTPEAPFRELAAGVGLSLGEVHNSSGRLETSHLLLPHRRIVNRAPFLGLLLHGVPYVYPGELGPETQGVPTAHSAPAFHNLIHSDEMVVWPSLLGSSRGSSLTPLCKAAPSMPQSNPELYRFLTIIDALRVGRSRERELARRLLEEAILSRPNDAE